MLNYYGAHTGRASGGDKVNLQNLPRGGALRKAIVAPKGHLLVACDSSQIEARTVAWLAGERELVDAFAQNTDIYSSFASEVYERPINKKDHPLERHVGKTSILGLGYGMSAAKFKGTLKVGKPSVEMAEQDCERVVNLYRTKYANIVRLWKESHYLLEAIAKGARFGVGAEGIAYAVEGGIALPNGMMLRYPELQKGEDGYTYKQRRETKKIYGAKVTENIVQALARIIVFNQMLAISKRYKVVLTVHDEVVIVAPEQEAEEAKAFMMEQMSIAPDWADGLPLACEADIGYSYGDCK
jgi:DNA polymerase